MGWLRVFQRGVSEGMALELRTDDVSTVSDADLIVDGDKTVTYEIRHITPEKNREIVKQHTQKVPNRRTHQRDDVTNWEDVADALIDYALVGWSGVVSKGQPLDCVLDHKKLLDMPRRTAILEKAGMNDVIAAPEVRSQSFRSAS